MMALKEAESRGTSLAATWGAGVNIAFTDAGALVRNGLRRPFCDLFILNTRP